MFQQIIRMWDALLYRLGYERKAKDKRAIDPNAQPYHDIKRINWFAMAVSKIKNLACTETTYEIKSDSALVEPLIALCEDIEEKRFDIVDGMLGTGDSYIFPSFDEKGNLYHSLLDESRVVIIDGDGESITKAYAILDIYKPDKDNRVFYLIRIHELDDKGNLTISYDTVNETGESVYVEEWQYLKGETQTFIGVNHIGFGRYKSPVSSRGWSDVYGVPLNFGCGDIERQIVETMGQIEDEFKNSKSLIFADPRIVMTDEQAKQYKIAENIFPVNHKSGDNGQQVDIFNPNIRYESYKAKLNDLLADYEKQMGLSAGILTENQAMATGTATAVRRANADTIAFIDSVHTALDKGNIMTLEADGIFLNIRRDLWEYNSDYYDVFADATEAWNMLITAHDKKAVSRDRLTKWIFPQMTDAQIAEELEKADEYDGASSQNALMSALNQ